MIWFLFALMLGTMLIGVPILLSIALVGYVGVAAVPDLVLPLFAQKMFAQLDSFTLLALPYFILAGALMSASGMSQQLVDFSRVLVGHLRAGLAHASVVASMVFAGVSGSCTADASAISAIVIPTMKRSGYKAGLRGGADRHRRHHRRDHPAAHGDGRLRRDRAGVDRRAVPRRDHSRHPRRPVPDGHDQDLHLPPGLPGTARRARPFEWGALGALARARCGRRCSGR